MLPWVHFKILTPFESAKAFFQSWDFQNRRGSAILFLMHFICRQERITFLKARKLEKIITSLNRPQSPPEDNWARNLRFRAVTRWASNHPFWGHIICFDFFNDVLTQGQNDDDYFCVSFEKTTNTHPRPLMENNNHNCETQ